MNTNTSEKTAARRTASGTPARATTSKKSASRPAAAHKATARKTPTRRAKAKGLKPMFARREGKRRSPRANTNLRTALWLWCIPVGFSMLWRRSCTWPKGVKLAITAVMVAVLVAIFAIPTPTADRYVSGVQMVSGEPEVEVYGPALPTLIVPGYTSETTGSIIAEVTQSDVHYVYAADGAKCYHEYECKFAYASSQRLTVYEAYFLGFQPCGRCNPPVYTPGVTDPLSGENPGETTATVAEDVPTA